MSRASARASVYAPAPLGATSAPSTSHMPLPPVAGTTALSSRIAAKHAELAALRQLRAHSARLAADIEALGDGVDVLVQGGQAVASVLSSWQGVFRAIQLARASTMLPLDATSARDGDAKAAAGASVGAPYREDGDAGADDATLPRRPLPDTLVRLPIESVASPAVGKLTE